jgi:signal transduction histidine kinase
MFVRNVSHHLRNPLHGILFGADMLAQNLFGPLNERQSEHVDAIGEAARDLEKLIGNILDVAMVDAGEMELELSAVDLRKIVEESAAMAALRAEDSEVRVQVECDAGIGAIRADEKRVRQILFNLVANAMGNTSPGDSVTIGAQRLDGMVRLYVSDTGRGIPYDEQAAAFDAFHSGDQRGAGLGLALVRSFMDLHGGWVALASEVGTGTTVTCHFPANEPVVAPPPAPTRRAERKKRAA